MDKITISHLGLTDKDLLLISNLFRLNETWFGNFELARNPGTSDGQFLILNLDQPTVIETWREMTGFKLFQGVIAISSSPQKTLPGTIPLLRPLVFRRLTEALNIAMRGDVAPAPEPRCANILVVDDSLPVQTHMKQKMHELISSPAIVDIAGSGEEALQKASDGRYDLVFMDVMMPGMDGYRACRLLKIIRQKTRVVMLTSKSSTLNRVKAKMSGCDAYICKPAEDSELLRVVTKYLPESTAGDRSAGVGMMALR